MTDKITIERETLQAALEALTESVDSVQHDYDSDWRHGMPTRKAQLDASLLALNQHRAAIDALRAALAAQPAEPVAWRIGESYWTSRDSIPFALLPPANTPEPLYTTQPAPAAVPLTDEQILEIADPFGAFEYGDAQGHKRIAFARAMIAAAGE